MASMRRRIVVADYYWDAPLHRRSSTCDELMPGAALDTHLGRPRDRGFTALAIDASGSVVAVGPAGPAQRSSRRNFELRQLRRLVVKLDDQGGVSWGKDPGRASTVSPREVAVAPNGDMVIAGFTSGSVTLPDHIPHKGEWDGSSSGWVPRATTCGPTSTATSPTMPYTASPPTMQVTCFLGGTSRTPWTSGRPLTSSSNTSNAFLVKLDAAGSHAWSRTRRERDVPVAKQLPSQRTHAILPAISMARPDFGQKVTPSTLAARRRSSPPSRPERRRRARGLACPSALAFPQRSVAVGIERPFEAFEDGTRTARPGERTLRLVRPRDAGESQLTAERRRRYRTCSTPDYDIGRAGRLDLGEHAAPALPRSGAGITPNVDSRSAALRGAEPIATVGAAAS